MAARDVYHDLVVRALIRNGWTITNDPLLIEWAEQDLEIDLGAEQVIAAENSKMKIAVEIKSFLNLSPITDFYGALGQYMTYERALGRIEPDRIMYLAMPLAPYTRLFSTKPIGMLFIEDGTLNLMVFDPRTEEIVKWIPEPTIGM